MGELKNDKRLIRRQGGSSVRGYSLTPWTKNAAYAKYADYAGYAMYADYEDFPTSESSTCCYSFKVYIF